MIKLFASDLDGTLLNATHMVDPIIVSALRTVTKSGAHFAVATGRTMRSPNDFGFHGVDIEAVCSNGSIILDRDGNTIYHSDVDKGVLEEMLTHSRRSASSAWAWIARMSPVARKTSSPDLSPRALSRR